MSDDVEYRELLKAHLANEALTPWQRAETLAALDALDADQPMPIGPAFRALAQRRLKTAKVQP